MGSPMASVNITLAADEYGYKIPMQIDGDRSWLYECEFLWASAKANDFDRFEKYLRAANRNLKIFNASVECNSEHSFEFAKFVNIHGRRPVMTVQDFIRLDANRNGSLLHWDNLNLSSISEKRQFSEVALSMFDREVIYSDANPLVRLAKRGRPIPKFYSADMRSYFKCDDGDYERTVINFDPVFIYPSFLEMFRLGILNDNKIHGEDF